MSTLDCPLITSFNVLHSHPHSNSFQVTFKVNKAATSPLVFGASVWKDGNKLQDATPISVSVRGGRLLDRGEEGAGDTTDT